MVNCSWQDPRIESRKSFQGGSISSNIPAEDEIKYVIDFLLKIDEKRDYQKFLLTLRNYDDPTKGDVRDRFKFVLGNMWGRLFAAVEILGMPINPELYYRFREIFYKEMMK